MLSIHGWVRRTLGLSCVLGLLVGGCAEERDPINRVGANALDKSFFVGQDLLGYEDDPQFYWRNYVIDGSASQSAFGVGTWSNVDRVRWEVTKDFLLARKAYELTPGADNKGKLDSVPNGTVVAAYAIEKHFDIRRAYNSSTGEELNIIEENSSDLTWERRKFMRVDWTRNLVNSPLWLDMFLASMFGNVELSPIAYSVADPSHPDAPHFETDEGYFDITSRFYVNPTESSLVPGIPVCVLMGIYTGSASYECDQQEATIRSSYQRIDPDADFEPLELTTAPADVVGNPAAITGSLLVGYSHSGKQGWDEGYGFTDELYHRFAHVHNIWQQSHLDAACTSNNDSDNDGTADACHPSVTGYSGSLGSQCDVFTQRCTVPYRDRQIKPVGYWVNSEMPADLQDEVDNHGKPIARGATEDVIFSWNQLLQNAVGHAREVECRRTGGERRQCHDAVFAAGDQMLSYGAYLIDKPRDASDVLVTCHNPVRGYDPKVCGAVGYQARLGDIRRNIVAYWPYQSRARYGGIGNWGADPLSGEIHGASAMIMGRSVTRAAAMQRDIIQLALGDISLDDVIAGTPSQLYAQYLKTGSPTQALDMQEIARRVAAVDADNALATIAPPPLEGTTIAEKFNDFVALQKTASPDVAALNSSQLEFEALAANLYGSQYEAQLVGGQWLTSMAGLSPDTALSDSVFNTVSPLRALDAGTMQALRSRIGALMELKGVCFDEAQAPALGSTNLQGLARYFGKKYPAKQFDAVTRGALIYRDLYVEAYKGIAVHEVGHSLGLLHNFASSWDASNYHPQYWQLRTHEGTSTASCNGKPRTGDTSNTANDTCMGPRYLDPETDDELGVGEQPRPGLVYFGNSSVMEYSSERFGETSGLGTYDAHAMNSLYGRVLETFDTDVFSIQEQQNFAPRLETQRSNYERVIRNDAPFAGQTFAKPTHYTKLARLIKAFDASRCREASEEEKAAAQWRIVHGKVCAPIPRDYAAWNDFEHGLAQPNNSNSLAPFVRTRATARTGGGQVRWFYRYGTSNNSYIHTQSTDAGADAYEVTRNVIDAFDATYPWRYFRRKNREYFSASLPARASSRTFERLRAYHWNGASTNAFLRAIGPAVFTEVATADDWHRPMLMAETEMFNALARFILTPEPGLYGPRTTQPVDAVNTIFDIETNSIAAVTIGIPDARYIGPEYDSGPTGGGSWNYLKWMKHEGFGSEKVLAARALTDGRPVLSTISRQNFLDPRGVNINFRSDMPQALDRLIGGVLAEDWDAVGMFVQGTGNVVPQMLALHLTQEEPTRPEGSKVLFGNIGYKQQLGVLMFAQLYSRMGTDMTLSNKMRLWLDGDNNAITIADEQQIRFYHPSSGYTYVARRYGNEMIDGKEVERGIASRMLQHANALLAATYRVQLDAAGEVVIDGFGSPILLLDGDGQPMLQPSQTRLGELNKYVGLLDATRQIASRLGQGPL